MRIVVKRDNVLQKALSTPLKNKLAAGGAHWVTVKEGPLEGRHLLIDGPRPAGGRQSRGKILAGHGIPPHVIEKITGATHAHHVEHEVSEGPKDDLSAKRKERDEKHARHAKALEYGLSDTKRRLKQFESYGEELSGFKQKLVDGIRASIKMGDAIMAGEKDPTDEELRSVTNSLDGAGPALQAMIEGAEKRKWQKYDEKIAVPDKKDPVQNGPFTEQDASRYNNMTHFPTTADKLNSEYQEQRASDRDETIKKLARYGVRDVPEDVEEALSRLHGAHEHFVREHIRAREVAPPWSVTGRANYSGRPDKAEVISRNSLDNIEKAKKNLARVIEQHGPHKRISSDESDAVQQLRDKIQEAEKRQDMMKEANKIANSKKLSEEQKVSKLISEYGFKEKSARVFLEPNRLGHAGFASFELTNNNANIKRMKDRVEDLKRKQGDSSSEHSFDGGTIADNVDDNRVRIFFDDKPGEEIRRELKSRGFKWAPSVGAWQRMRSADALRIAREIVGAEKVTKSVIQNGRLLIKRISR